jgi:hypothetical protein
MDARLRRICCIEKNMRCCRLAIALRFALLALMASHREFPGASDARTSRAAGWFRAPREASGQGKIAKPQSLQTKFDRHTKQNELG